MSYYRDVYLKSDEWKRLKAEKRSKTHRRCSVCGATDLLDLHHLFYRSNLNDAQTSDLRWLCRRCHDVAHELMDSRRLMFKPGMSHHAMFALTKSRVIAVITGIPLKRIDDEHPMAKKINALRTGPAGWSRKALEQLGVPWPPPKGWRKELIRKAIEADRQNNVARFGH